MNSLSCHLQTERIREEQPSYNDTQQCAGNKMVLKNIIYDLNEIKTTTLQNNERKEGYSNSMLILQV